MRKSRRVLAAVALLVVVVSAVPVFGAPNGRGSGGAARFFAWITYRISTLIGSPATHSRLSPPIGAPEPASRLGAPVGASDPTPKE